MARQPVIIALDFATGQQALDFVALIEPPQAAVKVGLRLFMQAGPAIVQQLTERGFNVFLDLKFHDIPNTVQQAVENAVQLAPWMLDVHALGGTAMLRAAKSGLSLASKPPLLMAITLLTSMDAEAVAALGLSGSLEQVVLHLAQLAYEAELDGVVCSAHEVKAIKKRFSADFKCVTPGIRLQSLADDQKRVIAPADAIALGSDYLVIGRPIIAAEDPMAVLKQIHRAVGA